MQDSTPQTRREAFEFADSVCALEGLHPNPEAKAIHERIISGELSFDAGAALLVEAIKARAAAKRDGAPSA